MGDNLVLSDSAACDKFGDKNRQAPPPEVMFYNSLGIKAAKMT